MGLPKGRAPGKEELLAARGRSIPDVIAPGLRILFCGINPSLYSGATGHHFARPGNRFWKALHGSGLTPVLLAPHQDRLLPDYGLGVVNLVNRATASASEISGEELREGGAELARKVERYRPALLAVLGIGAYRDAFGRPAARPGLQPERIGTTPIWVLPNPSGLNASYQLGDLVRLFAELREAAPAR